MKIFLGIFSLFFCLIIQSYAQKPSVAALIEQTRKIYAPDKRIAIFQISIDSASIVGKTNLLEAKKKLLASLKNNGYVFNDAIRLLPEKEVGEQTYGFINISVANLRAEPKDPAELVSQALLGTPIKILEKEKLWYLVQTPDKYIAWVDHHAITRMSKSYFEHYNETSHLIFTKPFGFTYEKPEETAQSVSDLVMGDILVLIDSLPDFYKVSYPDGRNAYVLKQETKPYNEWVAGLDVGDISLINTAKKMMGIPYLWGGTSFKGVDCSGFTRMIYQMNGLYLPRDASQQVHLGESVSIDEDFDKLEVGDLLFFGERSHEDKPERISHVAMWIGNKQFIHASGMVRIGSFDKANPYYDAYNLSRLLKTKRILGSQYGIINFKPNSIY